MMRIRNRYLAVLACMLSPMAQAGIIISVDEIGSDVVFSYLGSLDTDGLTFKFYTHGRGLYNGNSSSSLAPSVTAIAFGVGDSMQGFGLTSFLPSSTIDRSFFGTTTGDGFALFSGNTVALPIGYVSGSTISGSLTFASHSFESLGLIFGIYETFLPSQDFIRMEISSISVPEPSTLSLFGVGLLGLVLMRRRRRA